MKSQDLIPETLDSILEGILTDEDDDIFAEDTTRLSSSCGSSSSSPQLPAAVCHTSVIVTNPHSQQQQLPRPERSLLAEIFICYEKGRLLLKSEEEVQVKAESPDSCCSEEDSLLVSTFFTGFSHSLSLPPPPHFSAIDGFSSSQIRSVSLRIRIQKPKCRPRD
jgi:hypothetical protein